MCKFQVSLIIYFSCKMYFCLLNPVTFFLFLLSVSFLYLLDSKVISLLVIETFFHLVNLGSFFTIVFSAFCVQIPGHLFVCFLTIIAKIHFEQPLHLMFGFLSLSYISSLSLFKLLVSDRVLFPFCPPPYAKQTLDHSVHVYLL